MSDAFTDVAKMRKIKEEINLYEGQVVEMMEAAHENGLLSRPLREVTSRWRP